MRITGGVLAGRKVEVPPGVIRPAMDRMRESVFGALGDLSGLSFLDLFSGSGVIALEAASRGASYIEAVEGDKGKSKTLIANAALAAIRCRFMSVELYIKRAKRSFDIVFCDPPFPYRYKNELVSSLCKSMIIARQSLVVFHHPKYEKLETPENFLIRETKIFGASAVDFIQGKEIQ